MNGKPDYTLVIESGKSELNYWKDLWKFRELFYFLSWRDILVRYKQTAIGVLWAVIRPMLTIFVFTFVFGKIAKLPDQGVPYPILVFTGTLAWQFFSNSLSECSNSLVANANLLTKIYFPRMIVPASAVIVGLVDFLISFALLIVFMAWYRVVVDWRIVVLPLFLLLAFLCSFGFGVWFAAMNVKYRDFRYVVPFLLQLGLYVSPVGFSSTVVPEKWRLLYSVNPMVAVIDGFRWAILRGAAEIYWPGLLISCCITGAVAAYAINHFRKVERGLSDII